MIPPLSLLRSPWLPFIVAFYWRAVTVLFRFGSQVGVSSWFRTPDANRDAGGDRESQHLFALAWDVVTPVHLLDAVAQVARGAGLIAVPNPREGIVHLQLFPAGALARAGVTFPE